MDEGGRNQKTYVSTFRLDLKPAGCVEKHRGNGPGTSKRMDTVNSKLGVSSSTDANQTPTQALEAPQFKEPLQDCAASEGSDASFQGVITGSQSICISWLHNGERMHQGKTSFKSSVASLAVVECSPGDGGIYTCVAENAAGKQASSAVLHITDTSPQTKDPARKGSPVEFLDSPEQVEVRVGEQARLHCVFSSSCVPVACCWIYNREKVVGGRRTCVRSSEMESSVEISQACPDDTGSYTVIVRNPRGSGQRTVSLSVIDRPHPPASHPVFSRLSTQSLVLSWTGPSYDGGTAVLGYVVEVRQEGLGTPGDWTEVTTRCKSTSYQVHSGLDPLGEYRFRVRAYNSAGVSEPSEESDCVKMTTAKQEQKEKPQVYTAVTIDTTHKIKDHYNVHEKLGVGKFGQVFRLSHKETGQVCAGKFYRARSLKEKKAARREIELMNCLHHPKLVQCLAAYDTRPELVMVLEYIAGGELFERILDDNFEHTEPTSARYVQQILEAMRYVHTQNIVHLDLKPENIVCVDTTGTQIKIIDFGLASKLEPGKPLMVMHGTPEFVAPEVISYEPVGLETDMWSIGVICFILLSGESPFQGNSNDETLALVTAARYEFDEESFEDISDQAKDFLSSLLKKDRRCRLSCDEALAHPWMVSFTPLNRRSTKSLNKEKIRRFLAKRKWKKTGKAVLALQRMANLSNRPEFPGSPSEEPGWSQEAAEAIQSLEKQLQTEPRFQQPLKDATLPKGATAQLTCLVHGYPEPEVEWLQGEEPVVESSRVTMEHHDDGLCSLLLADLGPSDSGVYKCRATNDLGDALCSAKLTVEM